MNFRENAITLFHDDLCKDQREIVIYNDTNFKSSTGKIIRKYNLSTEEYENEVSVINFLIENNYNNVPKIVGNGKEYDENGILKYYLDIEYYDGIRVFNVLAYLREIEQTNRDLSAKVKYMRNEILLKCFENQVDIQALLKKWANKNNRTKAYPKYKLNSIVFMLKDVLRINVDDAKLEEELDYILAEFEKSCAIPFRDSTTKNMVIYYPKLYLGNYVKDGVDVLSADEIRKKEFIELLKNDIYLDIINSPIIDFDFSSCEYLTSEYDDPIGFFCHEITWGGVLNKNKLIWEKKNNDINDRELAISFIMRYIRFGGRKLAYHIFHPNAYKYRFKYDNELFYFNNLIHILEILWPESKDKIPNFIKFIKEIVSYKMQDHTIKIDEFENKYPESNRRFYIDVFPF